MPRPKKPKVGQTVVSSQMIFDAAFSPSRTAPCVLGIEQEVGQWRAKEYPGITKTTRSLLHWWFQNDHRTTQGKPFRFYPAQREALETLIYLFEVKKIRRRGQLLLTYARGQQISLPSRDEFPRFAIKMATGSGKTKVMALVIVWQVLNAFQGEGEDYATTFLLLAPNIIVLERLKSDFAAGKIFQTDPLIPPEMQFSWDLKVYLRGEPESTMSFGALYLTNIQQLYLKKEDLLPKLNPLAALLGPPPPTDLQPPENFLDRLEQRGNCLVLNDEAHHTHQEDSAWNDVIAELQNRLGSNGLRGQLDFSATPRHADGTLFNWTIYDYPLLRAIKDGLVKRPLKGVAEGVEEIATTKKASERYEAYLVAGVERWKEYQAKLAPLQKKPVLFVMLSDTKEADDVGEWLRNSYPNEFGGEKLLVIHTNREGEVSEKDLPAARQAAREVDQAGNPINALVSVLMLREGWDVNNVTVIVGLRPYTAKAKILPEQTVGRGLRLLFGYQSGYAEEVDLIGNDNFMQIVADLEQEEGVTFDTFSYGKKKTPLTLLAIQVIPERVAAFELAIPLLSPRLSRRKDAEAAVNELDLSKIKLANPFSLTNLPDLPGKICFTYKAHDFITGEEVLEREYEIPQTQTASAILAFYTQEVARSLKLPTHFAPLTPKIEQFLREALFDKAVDLNEAKVLNMLKKRSLVYYTVGVFNKLLGAKLIAENIAVWEGEMRQLSTILPFPWSGEVADCQKTLFNLTPCANRFEANFARFLDKAQDIVAFAHLGNLKPNLTLEYLDAEAHFRLYEPDFVARSADQTHWLIETKGQEDHLVPFKDQRAQQWCADATKLTGIQWRYLKVSQEAFETSCPNGLQDLFMVRRGGLFAVDEREENAP